MPAEDSLWRDGRLVGRFEAQAPMMRHGQRVGVSGVLMPAAGIDLLVGVMQTRMRTISGEPTFQTALERLDLAGPVVGATRMSQVELRPLCDLEARGVPRALILEVRGPDGVVRDAEFVALQQFVVPAGAATRWEVPDDWGSCWLVSFAVHGAWPIVGADGADREAAAGSRPCRTNPAGARARGRTNLKRRSRTSVVRHSRGHPCSVTSRSFAPLFFPA